MTVDRNEFVKNREKIDDLLEKLKSKLIAFEVINLEGKLIGQIRDFTLDKYRRLYMVVPPPSAQPNSPVYLISSRYIQKVETPNRIVFVDLSLAELEHQPVYDPSKHQVIEAAKQSSMSPMTQPSHPTSGEGTANINSTPTEVQPAEYAKIGNSQDSTESEDTPEVVEEEIIRLLEERVVVNRSKRKVGEIVVRKEIETRIVEVPIYREKLIVEQVGAETKQLAEIDLGQGEVRGVELAQPSSAASEHQLVTSTNDAYTVSGEFLSPRAASNLLEAIALQKPHGCKKVRVELVVENPEFQESYQKMFDRCAGR